MSKIIGFTIIETLVALAILFSLLAMGIPQINSTVIETRVDNEIFTLHRLLLVARNTALTQNSNVTLCPLNERNQCINTWQNQLTVFTDANNNKVYEPNLNEKIITIKDIIKKGDKLQYGKTRIGLTYSATGHLSGWGQNATFSYCPKNHTNKSKGIIVAISGRTYISNPNETFSNNIKRSGSKIICY